MIDTVTTASIKTTMPMDILVASPGLRFKDLNTPLIKKAIMATGPNTATIITKIMNNPSK